MNHTQLPHYHIRWLGKATLDWQGFGTHAEAEARAKQLAHPDETYTIEEHVGACPRCLQAMKPKIATGTSKDWELLYTAAILEPDRSKLNSRIDAAQAAIASRLQEMKTDHGGSAEENLEMETAQVSLGVMRKRVAMPQHSPPE